MTCYSHHITYPHAHLIESAIASHL
uniref:Uncharacterized protein n=1 Tax=Arundo donax TaxID=35708 RepID=A0A0A9EXX3_ARUDO